MDLNATALEDYISLYILDLGDYPNHYIRLYGGLPY